jgi:hypothetical protein
MDEAERFAGRLKSEAGDDASRQVGRAFELAFNRQPESSERDAAKVLIGEHGLPAFCRAILNSNELMFIP